MVYFFFHGFIMRIGLILAKCGAFLACIKKYTQQFYLSHVLTSYLHCFSCSDSQVYPLKSGITARKRANPWHSLQRFPISAPELAITAAPDSFPWISPQPNGVRHGAATEECRMGRDFGRRSRPWLRERRGACRAAAGGKAPQVRTGPKSLPAGRFGRGNAPWKGAGVL